ncbi:hypothetical protein SPHINGOAX6_50372 [Sphingomonas sp. AX6]|nr:hypothetical protein SPHINGOAX6_50372 [Sphingomonas sp. AX6]
MTLTSSLAGCGSIFPHDGDAVQLHPVIDEAEAQAFGDLLLQQFKLGIDEFDDLAGLDIDQMIVMRLGRGFVAGAAIAEIVTVEDARFFEQAHGAIDGGDRYAGVDRGGAGIDLFHIGMVFGLGKHAGDHAALLGDAQALFVAECFEVDLAGHHVSLGVPFADLYVGRDARERKPERRCDTTLPAHRIRA